jgi:hypothetical protein
MEPSNAPRVLLVAHKTATSQGLLDAVRERAAAGPCSFTLLVPNPVHGLTRVMDPEDAARTEGEAVLAKALPLLEEAAGAPVKGMVGVAEAVSAVQDAVHIHGFDEVIVSTLTHRLSSWLRLDLPSKIRGLGLPVTTVTEKENVGAPAAPA